MKFGRYLAENLTPEWKRAYIDYRGCKKKIKIIAARLGDVKKAEGDEGDKEEDNPDSSGDDDHGPSAPPRKPSPSTLKENAREGSAGGRTPSIGRGGGRFGTPVTRAESRRGMSPHYGATATSPRPVGHHRHGVPPPLDIGESSYPEESTLASEANKAGLHSTRLGMGSIIVENETEQDNQQNNIVQSPSSSEGSKRRSSDEGMETSDSARPLTSPMLNRVKASPRVGKSPRFAQSPKIAPSPKVPQPSPKAGSSPKHGPSPQIGGGRRSLRSMTLPSPRTTVRSAQSFEELYDSLEDDERAFFDLLEHELNKVEAFYSAREAECQRRAHDLRDQLRELAEHRKVFHEMYPNGLPDWEAKVGKIIPVPNGSTATGIAKAAQRLRQRLTFASTDEDQSNGDAIPGTDGMDEATKKRVRDAIVADTKHEEYNPERYQKYKRDLRSASLEFYRQLELVKNYRILNLTGFRKALKKFEKTTKIHCMEMYTDEKISKESFAKGETIDNLIKQMEDLFTEHFEHGDQKRARDKLRRQDHQKTHYISVFRSGICVGLGLPAAVFGIVEAYNDVQRAKIPGWEGLLQIYGGFYLPIIFALLFQLNLDAYVSARINYEFVMELSKPVLDYRSYAEIPAFLFLTLSYCFFFSFHRVASQNVDPTTWPLAWLVFAIVFFLNPLDIFRRKSRYWFLRVLFRVCTPGYSRVEFIAFFLADELNSLTYTIQNIYFIACTYSHHWPGNIYTVCPSGQQWPYALLLCLPALSRLIQCLKRWKDSGLGIHLINAGKYLSTIAQLCLFVLWRSRGRPINDASFIVWVIIATASAIYTSAWDLIVDWSLLRPEAGLLRHDRGYASQYVYYFAMVSNVLVRFIWVWYIPDAKHHTQARSFYFALAEMLRRWQWNFFRVETEHLGNADAYRVTREIPLPYRRIEHDSEEDDDTRGLARSKSKLSVKNPLSIHLDRLKREIVGSGSGRGPDELNVGPRGHTRQREYEARRPGDTPSSLSGGEV